MPSIPAYAAQDARSPLTPFAIDRRAPGPRDVQIDILYCGVCHSDIHQARDEWGGGIFPMVPGHEIVGGSRRLAARCRNTSPATRSASAASSIPAVPARTASRARSSIATRA